VSLAPFAEPAGGGPRTPGKNCLAEQARPEQQLMLAREGARPIFSVGKPAEGPRWLSASPVRTAADYGRAEPAATPEGEFLAWVQSESRWQPLIDAFQGSQRYKPVVNGTVIRPHIERADFKRTLSMMRFKGDADAVFDLIVAGRQADGQAAERERPGADAHGSRDCMYLSDLRRYKDRQAPRAMELITGGGGAIELFVGALQRRRGTLLRGWRMDLDKSGLGKVAFGSFAAACRKYDLGEHCKGMWKSMCPTGGMLLFSELAPQESENIEAFVDAAGKTTGYDLGKAWEFIDACRWNSVSFDDFERGAQDMGFTGDCRLLFDGIEVEGTRRVTRDDLVYLENLSQNPALAARRKLKNNTGALTDLISWVQSEGGGAENFVAQLGQRKISLSELEAHLAARGFPFAAREAAIQAARNEPGGDGQNISASSLLAMLKGKEVSWKTRSPSRPRPQPRQPATADKGWDNAVNDLSRDNLSRHRTARGQFAAIGQESVRSLFVPGAVVGYLGKQYRLVEQHQPQYSTPDRAWLVEDEHGLEKVLKESAVVVVGDAFKPPPRRVCSVPKASINRMDVVRPAWDGALDLSATVNARLPSASRKYFSDPYDRTAKEAIQNTMRQNQVVVCVSKAGSRGGQSADAVRPEEQGAAGPCSPRAGAFPDVRSDEQVYGFVQSPRSAARRSRR